MNRPCIGYVKRYYIIEMKALLSAMDIYLLSVLDVIYRIFDAVH